MGDRFVVTPSAIGQPTWPTQPSILRGRLMSSNACYSWLRRQTAEGVVRGVAYRPRQRVLLAARLEYRLAAGSRPRNGDLAIGDFVFVFCLGVDDITSTFHILTTTSIIFSCNRIQIGKG